MDIWTQELYQVVYIYTHTHRVYICIYTYLFIHIKIKSYLLTITGRIGIAWGKNMCSVVHKLKTDLNKTQARQFGGRTILSCPKIELRKSLKHFFPSFSTHPQDIKFSTLQYQTEPLAWRTYASTFVKKWGLSSRCINSSHSYGCHTFASFCWLFILCTNRTKNSELHQENCGPSILFLYWVRGHLSKEKMKDGIGKRGQADEDKRGWMREWTQWIDQPRDEGVWGYKVGEGGLTNEYTNEQKGHREERKRERTTTMMLQSDMRWGYGRWVTFLEHASYLGKITVGFQKK